MLPEDMLPNTNHPSTLSVLQCDNHTVFNVLVDLVIVKIIAFIALLKRWTLRGNLGPTGKVVVMWL